MSVYERLADVTEEAMELLDRTGQLQARMRDDWFFGSEGLEACAGQAEGRYLRNRLESALAAGMRIGAILALGSRDGILERTEA